MLHALISLTSSKLMNQCQFFERYMYDGSKTEIKMPYNYDTSYLYSKYIRKLYYMVKYNE